MKCIVLVCLWGVIGCGNRQTNDCGAAFDHVRTVALASTTDQKADSHVPLGKIVEAEAQAGVARCQADRWKPEVTACLKNAATDDSVTACFKLLSTEQQAAFNKAADEASAKYAPHGVALPPAENPR